jgi:hypothetical protein
MSPRQGEGQHDERAERERVEPSSAVAGVDADFLAECERRGEADRELRRAPER